MTYIAKINGTPIPFHDHKWSLVVGFVAPVQSWVVPAEIATALVNSLPSGGREITLVFGDAANPTTVRRVYVIGTAPADNPQRLNILLADVRIYLGFQVFVIDLNVRRRLGDTRVVGAGIVTSTLADDIGYAPWTINGQVTPAKAFRWGSAKNQALAILTAPRHGRPALSWTTDSISLNPTEQVIQETITDSDGVVGLARAIESVPGAGLYVDLDGVLHVCDSTPGAETTMVQALPKTLWRHGDLQKSNLAGLRPNNYRLLVDYALAMRLDYVDTNGGKNAGLRNLDNVLQVTDRSLSIPAGNWGAARVVGEGTWITIEEAFAAWGSKTIGSFVLPVLTDQIVAAHWFGDCLQRYCLGGGLTKQDPIWSARIQELMKCWRTYFRVRSTLWDRVRHWWPHRVDVWDPVTGTHAPAPIYSNFHYMPLDEFHPDPRVHVYGSNKEDSYPTGDGKLKSGSPSGFEVDVVDEELMVFRVIRSSNRYPGHTRLTPSPTIDGVTVVGGPGFNEAVLQTLWPLATSTQPTNPASWVLSTVVTMSPASPNDQRRLYEVIVPVGDAVATLGSPIPIPDCRAPDQELRSHLTEARVPWLDETVLDSEKVFGDSTSEIGPDDPVRTLTPINLNSELIPLARAMAAAHLVQRLDHYEGSKAVPMSKAIVPIGSVHTVTHRVLEDKAITVIEAGGHVTRSINYVDFLPASARSYLLKEIQKQR